MSQLIRALVVFVALAGTLAGAAAPDVPLSVSYQGVLLDDQGMPRTGNVDLTLRIHDAIAGGTLVYKQTYSSVPLTDGVFSIVLGPTGDASDVPADPLTTSLPDALAADVGVAAPERFLEVTVGDAGALTRTQVLAVPFAVRASSADFAVQAQTATDATQIGGLSSDVVTEIYQHFNFDGGPANDDPLEGTGDFDGDGIANFVDPDNDDDTISDDDEVGQGTGVNAVTPVIQMVTPAAAVWSGDTVAVDGLNFEAGLAVQVGSESPVPAGLTSTSFSIDVAPQPAGVPVVLQVTRLNGETASVPFSFRADQAHGLPVLSGAHLGVAVNGNQQIAVTNGSASAVAMTSSGVLDGTLGGVRAVGWSPAGRAAALTFSSGNAVDFAIDDTGNYDFKPSEERQIEPGTGQESDEVLSASIGFDPSGGAVAGYLRDRGVRLAVVAHDRDGNDDFLGVGEVVTVEPLSFPVAQGLGAVAVSSTARVAYCYFDLANGLLRLAWDRSGDGDYQDTVAGNPELSTVVATPELACLGATFDAADVLSIVYAETGSPAMLLRDYDGDGTFAGAGESVAISGGSPGGCDVAWGGGLGLSLAHDEGGELHLLVDTNGDGDFSDTGEARVIGLASAGPYAPLSVGQGAGGRSIVATASDVFFDSP